uniref:Uncharacterized protein n=1 Tax=Romanomermis culicivorax TaxID=13658 RepID=A0A915HVS2_ROMCU
IKRAIHDGKFEAIHDGKFECKNRRDGVINRRNKFRSSPEKSLHLRDENL